MPCGRIRKEIGKGLTMLVDGELKNLKMGVISLDEGEIFKLETQGFEYACVLITGKCDVHLESGMLCTLGPRSNPFEEAPFGVIIAKDEYAAFSARKDTLIGVGCAPAQIKKRSVFISPETVGGGLRGKGNWSRDVRFVLWSDNTEGNMLIAGETCTPSGNWSTIPPHRHQYYIEGEEVPYEETYFFQFSKPQGYGMAWQFNDEKSMDQAFSLKNNDVLYMDQGYHPTVCGPGAILYHLTFISGPYRASKSRVHDDFRLLLEENNMENPYIKQYVKKQTPDLN